MNRSGFAVVFLTLTIALLAGCVSHPPSATPEPTPPSVARSVETEAKPVPEPSLDREDFSEVETPVERATTASTPERHLPPDKPEPSPTRADVPGERLMLVASEPAGAVVVIDGRPVGATPLEVSVPVTDRGFLSRQMTVKVRFLANGTHAQSHTVELTLTQLDRVPARVNFTPNGAKRILAAFK